MRNHVLAFHTTTLIAGVTLGQVPAVPEQAFTISGAGNFQVPFQIKIFAGYVGGSIAPLQARINTGSLRQRGFPNIYPLSATTLPAPQVPVMDMRPYPILAQKEEDLRVDVSTTAAVQDQIACLWITPEPINYNIGPIDLRPLFFTAVVPASSAFVWSAPATVVLQDNIEGGVYDIYGMAVQQATGIAARLILQGEFFRPGVLCQALVTGQQHPMFWGQTGRWASFNTYSPPQIETFTSNGAGSTISGWLLAAKSMAPTITSVPGAPGVTGY
jgi:hypothetical protein